MLLACGCRKASSNLITIIISSIQCIYQYINHCSGASLKLIRGIYMLLLWGLLKINTWDLHAISYKRKDVYLSYMKYLLPALGHLAVPKSVWTWQGTMPESYRRKINFDTARQYARIMSSSSDLQKSWGHSE